MLNDLTVKKIETMLEKIKEQITPVRIPVTDIKTIRCGYKDSNVVPQVTDEWSNFGKLDRWGAEPEEHRWFYTRIVIPDELMNKDLELYAASTDVHSFKWDPQYMVYINGQFVRGMDSNHRYVKLDSSIKEQDIHVYAYSRPFGEATEFHCEICLFERETEKLFYNIFAPYKALELLNELSEEYVCIKTHLHKALKMLDWRRPGSEEFIESVKKANAFLEEEFYKKACRKNEKITNCIGHTHIDVAWRWTYQQSREKAQRTFSTVCALMEKYPEFKFMSSQPQLYEYIKEDCPELYEKIKKYIAEGRFEPEGSMWVEADCNLISGESFVRQIMFGKRFFKEEFGKDNHLLWLPDVFGYNAAMPQILKKSGIDAFVTSKISWNEFDRMPYDHFNWYGIDGTSIFSVFMTATDLAGGRFNFGTSYTAMLNPSFVKGSYDRYEPKELNGETLLTFGHGDGGGGPTDENMEFHRRMKYGIPGLPSTNIEFAGSYIDRMRAKLENNPELPKWVGELYLEFHRGTYTSVAKNKKNNRKSEFLYQNAESAAYMAKVLLGCDYDRESLNAGWKTILLNQFHDILPGSSIQPVYNKSDEDYAEVRRIGTAVLDSARKAIAENIKTDGGLLVFNPNPFKVSGAVESDGEVVYVKDIPSKGYKVVTPEKVTAHFEYTDKKIETNFYIVEFADDYSISRLYDKKNCREVLRTGGRANVIEAFEDYPYEYDNWELSNYYEDTRYEINNVVSTEFFDEGERFGIIIKRTFLDSTFDQKICFYEHDERIDFVTLADWKQEHYMVKAAFDVDLNTDRATYDIQFGAVERSTHKNTSWDAAKFEVCGHKFVDMGEYGYGVSLMNDCKYGHNIKDGTMKLSLFKCGTHPDPNADKILHSFTYSLYPHSGNYREAGTVRKAYELNNPLVCVQVEKQDGKLDDEYSLVSCDAENFIAETVKMAEDSDAVIVRGYECFNKRSKVKVTFGFDIRKVYLCDLMENEETELSVNGNSVEFDVKPFEIITLKAR